VLGSRDGGIHRAQEMYDQASMVREFVKWDYELHDGVQVAAVLDRAIDIAMTTPRAPAELGPAVAYEQYATASGGFGEAVTERAGLVPALRRGLHAVQSEHRQAVVNVSCAD